MFIHERELCIQCSACVNECPCSCLTLEDDAIRHDASRCMWCGHCLSVCPRDAIMINGDGYNVEDVEEFQFFKKSTPDMIRRDIMMRRSVRSFDDTPVSDDELERIIEAAKYAPTARNRQNNMLKVVTDAEERAAVLEDLMEQSMKIGEELKRTDLQRSAIYLNKYEKYKEDGSDGLFYDAPLIIFVFSDTDIDGAICAATMGQVIGSLGLGFCYVRLAADPMNTEELRAKYNIPEDRHCVIALAVGTGKTEYFCSVPRKDLPLL